MSCDSKTVYSLLKEGNAYSIPANASAKIASVKVSEGAAALEEFTTSPEYTQLPPSTQTQVDSFVTQAQDANTLLNETEYPTPFGTTGTTPIKPGLTGLMDYQQNKLPSIVSTASGLGKMQQQVGISDNPCEALSGIQGMLSGVMEIGGQAVDLARDVFDAITGAIDSVLAAIEEAVQQGVAAAQEIIETAIAAAQGIISEAMTLATEAMSMITDTMQSIIDQVTDLIPAITLPSLFQDPCANGVLQGVISPEMKESLSSFPGSGANTA